MKRTIEQTDKDFFNGKRVLMRVDFNVPQHDDGSIADDSRIRAALPSIVFLLNAKAKLVLMSHLGRPKGRSEKLSLRPVADRLRTLIADKSAAEIIFASDCLGAKDIVNTLKPGDVCLLENLRFYSEEEKNDLNFAKQLAALGDIYVDDAFGTAHRAHASTEGITHFLRPALAGLLLAREVKMLSATLDNPLRPFATIIGGAKVSTKIGVLDNLLNKVDVLVIGGAMAFTFLKARGLAIGKSLVEEDQLLYCKELEKKAKDKSVKLILPLDVVCASTISASADKITVPIDQIPSETMGLDIGPLTVQAICRDLRICQTILWNGPLGVFETSGFEAGTYALIDELVKLTQHGVKTIVGGGDSVAALKQKNVPDSALTHVSTGGGASLEFLEGLELPGIACLDEVEATAVR